MAKGWRPSPGDPASRIFRWRAPRLFRSTALILKPVPIPISSVAGFSQEPSVCEQIIAFFEARAPQHFAGRTGQGLDISIKNSTDLTVLPSDLDKPGHEPIASYLRQLEICCRDYAAQWPVFGGMMSRADLVPFTIQRYREGGHFQRVHSERTSFAFMHRVLAWMTYLNDVEEGGETRFQYYDLDVRPERGKTLIFSHRDGPMPMPAAC